MGPVAPTAVHPVRRARGRKCFVGFPLSLHCRRVTSVHQPLSLRRLAKGVRCIAAACRVVVSDLAGLHTHGCFVAFVTVRSLPLNGRRRPRPVLPVPRRYIRALNSNTMVFTFWPQSWPYYPLRSVLRALDRRSGPRHACPARGRDALLQSSDDLLSMSERRSSYSCPTLVSTTRVSHIALWPALCKH